MSAATPPRNVQTAENCACERPLPQERAVQKGASETVCARCGKPVSLLLGRDRY